MNLDPDSKTIAWAAMSWRYWAIVFDSEPISFMNLWCCKYEIQNIHNARAAWEISLALRFTTHSLSVAPASCTTSLQVIIVTSSLTFGNFWSIFYLNFLQQLKPASVSWDVFLLWLCNTIALEPKSLFSIHTLVSHSNSPSDAHLLAVMICFKMFGPFFFFFLT